MGHLAVVNEVAAQNIKKTDGILERPSRIKEDLSSLSPEEKARKFKQSAIEDILQSVMTRDAALKEQGPEMKNIFKRPL